MGKYGDATKKYQEAQAKKFDSIAGFPGAEVRKAMTQMEDFLSSDDGKEALEMIAARYGDTGVMICEAECSPGTTGGFFLTGDGFALRYRSDNYSRSGTPQTKSVSMAEVVVEMLNTKKLDLVPHKIVPYFKSFLDKIAEEAPE